jgi:hypothetical protein
LNNPLGAQDIPLTVFGGAITEMAPSDLPEGSSPWNQDCDYLPGSVFTRAGRVNQIYYQNLFIEKNAGFGQSVPDGPNETPWNTPNFLTLDTPPNYANVTLNGTVSTPFSPGPFNTFIGLSAPSTSFGPGTGFTQSIPFFAHTVGNWIVVGIQLSGTASVPSISDTAGMTWLTVIAVAGFGVWMARATAGAVSGCTITTTVGAAAANAALYGYEILNSVIGLKTYLTGANENFGQTATVNIGALAGSTMHFNGANVAYDQGTVCFVGSLGSVMLNFIGSAAGTLSDPGGNVNWNAINGSGAPGQLMQVWRYGGTVQPFPSFTAAPSFDLAAGGTFPQTGGSGNFDVGPLVPSAPNEFALYAVTPSIATINAGWSNVFSNLYKKSIAFDPNVEAVGTFAAPQIWGSVLGVFKTNGIVPTIANANTQAQATPAFPGTVTTVVMPNPTTAGNTVVVTCTLLGQIIKVPPTITDSQGNTYALVGSQFVENQTGTVRAIAMYIAQNIVGGALTVTATAIGGFASSGEVDVVEFTPFGTGGVATSDISEELQALNYPLAIPLTVKVLGFQVEVKGLQTTHAPDAIVTMRLLQPSADSPETVFQLPLVQGQVTLGTPTTTWGLQLTPALLNDPNFGVEFQATALSGTLSTFDISAAKLKVFLTPDPPQNFNWIKSYEQTDGKVDTLALDAAGILWDEDAINNPGVLNSIFVGILPNSYASSITFNDIEFIAISNLVNGTDIPRQWNGTNLDRVSQVGPGAPPSFATTSSGANVLSITQHAQITLPTGAHDFLLVSAAPSAHGTFGTPSTPGNIMSLAVNSGFVPPADIIVGSNIVISGFPTINGQIVNNDPTGVARPAFYTVLSVGGPIPGQQSYDWITFQVPFTTFYNKPTPAGCKVQNTLATLTVDAQVPFLEVGNQFTLTGVVPAGWNNTFTVVSTPNASQLNITQTSLTGNVATYVFTIISGAVPTVGQFVTVTGTLNGNGIFNIVNGVITAASPTQFSVTLNSPNIAAAPETNANGIISGTIFNFDPANTVTNPIIGNAGPGGTIATSGVLGVGVRKAVVMFLTRNGFITPTSIPVQFNITLTATAIVASKIPIGPPDTVARIIAFTGAGGANFFYIPQPVTVTAANGQQVTYPATVVNDNTTTQVNLSFPDQILLRSTAIDIPGNNLFNTIELGACRGFVSYADRLFAWGEQTKIQNMLNLSFDGGVGTRSAQELLTLPGVLNFPLGWTVDPTNGGGGTLNVSPVFGNSYYIKNVTGGVQALYGMIEQGVFQDAYQVPIILSQQAYSVRVTARCPSGVVTGNLVMDLFSPKLNQQFGQFVVPLSSMTSNFAIFTGSLISNTVFPGVIPPDLLFRVYATNLPNNGDVELDRVEPFLTRQPVYSTQLRGSYANNQEAFDLTTGATGPNQNQQPINGAMVLFDTLYALKEASWYSTVDDGLNEPNQWTWKEVSKKVGTVGIHSFDQGAGWAVTADRNGLHLFTGGEPIKISQEIQSVWDLINWNGGAGPSIWVRVDETRKAMYVGVPIATPNKFMPEFPVAVNPQTPNVILMMSYRELNEGMAIAQVPGIKSTFSGKLISPEPARKWSFWNIKAPYADFIDRGNDNRPLWTCTGYQDSKLFQLIDGVLDDDGLAINGYYITYGFVKPEAADAKGLGLHRMQCDYLTATMLGTGTLRSLLYPDDPANPLPFILDDTPVTMSAQGDLEIGGVNGITSQRYFLRFGTNEVGGSFQLSKVVLSLVVDPWAPVRGTATGGT